jgi:hypothetical protein
VTLCDDLKVPGANVGKVKPTKIDMFLTNLNSDSSHPSFFEMFAQSALTSSLKPALKHGLATLARHIPALASAPQHTDEIFFGLLYVLEKHFLQEHGTSVSFY